MAQDVRRRLIYGHVAIAVVLLLSTAAAIIALRSSVHRTEEIDRIDQSLSELTRLRTDARELARAARKYLLTGDVAEREQATALVQRLERRTGDTPAGLGLRLGNYIVSVKTSMGDDRRDREVIERFESSLELVREPLAKTFDEATSILRARQDQARKSKLLARSAQWALVLAALLGVGLAAANMVLILRILRAQSTRTREVERDAERTTRSKTELVGAAEDLCARLQGVANTAEQLRRSGGDANEQRRVLESISAGVSQIEARLRRLVDVSGIQLGAVSLSRELFSVAPVLERAVRMHGKAATTRGVSVHVEPCPMLSVVADRERIGLVVGSLLEYSIEASSPGAELLVSAVPVDDGVRVSLLDARWIDSLGQATSTTVDDVSLQLCRQIVEAHGGHMGMDTNELGRARWFTLPAEPRVLR